MKVCNSHSFLQFSGERSDYSIPIILYGMTCTKNKQVSVFINSSPGVCRYTTVDKPNLFSHKETEVHSWN